MLVLSPAEAAHVAVSSHCCPACQSLRRINDSSYVLYVPCTQGACIERTFTSLIRFLDQSMVSWPVRASPLHVGCRTASPHFTNAMVYYNKVSTTSPQCNKKVEIQDDILANVSPSILYDASTR